MENTTQTGTFTAKDLEYITSAKGGAQANYRQRLVEICAKLDDVREALGEHEMRQDRDPKNWGFAGDMGYVASQLDEVLRFLGKNPNQG